MKYFAAQKKVPVFYDRNFQTPHYQVHAIPIPSNYVERAKQMFMVKHYYRTQNTFLFVSQTLLFLNFKNFQSMAEQKRFSLTEVPDTAELETILLQSGGSYFYLEIGDYRLIHTIDRYFPLQFAR